MKLFKHIKKCLKSFSCVCLKESDGNDIIRDGKTKWKDEEPNLDISKLYLVNNQDQPYKEEDNNKKFYLSQDILQDDNSIKYASNWDNVCDFPEYMYNNLDSLFLYKYGRHYDRTRMPCDQEINGNGKPITYEEYLKMKCNEDPSFASNLHDFNTAIAKESTDIEDKSYDQVSDTNINILSNSILTDIVAKPITNNDEPICEETKDNNEIALMGNSPIKDYKQSQISGSYELIPDKCKTPKILQLISHPFYANMVNVRPIVVPKILVYKPSEYPNSSSSNSAVKRENLKIIKKGVKRYKGRHKPYKKVKSESSDADSEDITEDADDNDSQVFSNEKDMNENENDYENVEEYTGNDTQQDVDNVDGEDDSNSNGSDFDGTGDTEDSEELTEDVNDKLDNDGSTSIEDTDENEDDFKKQDVYTGNEYKQKEKENVIGKEESIESDFSFNLDGIGSDIDDSKYDSDNTVEKKREEMIRVSRLIIKKLKD